MVNWEGIYHTRQPNHGAWKEVLQHLLATELGMRVPMPEAGALTFIAYDANSLHDRKALTRTV
ncbi:hypothetical protein MY11210_009287 [Beauveria gryllotalpidicola]